MNIEREKEERPPEELKENWTLRELNSWREESDRRNRHGSVFCPITLLDFQKAERKKRSQKRSHVTDVNCSLTVISFLSFNSHQSPFLSSVSCSLFFMFVLFEVLDWPVIS